MDLWLSVVALTLLHRGSQDKLKAGIHSGGDLQKHPGCLSLPEEISVVFTLDVLLCAFVCHVIWETFLYSFSSCPNYHGPEERKKNGQRWGRDSGASFKNPDSACLGKGHSSRHPGLQVNKACLEEQMPSTGSQPRAQNPAREVLPGTGAASGRESQQSQCGDGALHRPSFKDWLTMKNILTPLQNFFFLHI